MALGFGSGLAPEAPGTFGTLAAVPLYFALAATLSPAALLAAIAIAFVAGIWACGVTAARLGVADHGGIVWDEITAFMLVLYFTPRTLGGLAAAFGLFRLFDIVKPFPIGWIERHTRGGFGVMIDDLLAAAYAIAVLIAAERWLR